MLLFFRRNAWWVIMVVTAVVSTWILMNSAEIMRERAELSTCVGKLTVIQMGLFKYEEKYGAFPPSQFTDGNGNKHSWRVLILEFIDEDLYKQYSFAEPWDGPNNKQLVSKIPNCFRRGRDQIGNTLFVVVNAKDGIFHWDRSTKKSEVRKDSNSIIMVVESVSTDIVWTEPRDLNAEEMSFSINDRDKQSISTARKGLPIALYFDGTKTTIIEAHSPDRLRDCIRAISLHDEGK